jgi:hypoxanthine phosphoribosyltransferase|tara:strand:- start:251 stop:706 length:456 start_codon:yes stop_codon:yes gene_type:complete
MDRQKVEYDVVGFLAKSLALRFKINKKKFTHVIGISRGGLLPAKIISYALEAQLLSFGISSYADRKKKKDINIVQDIDFDSISSDSSILVVDDKVDTGDTLNFVKNEIEHRGCASWTVRYATLFAEKRAKDKVDHYGILVPNNTWIDFPWE